MQIVTSLLFFDIAKMLSLSKVVPSFKLVVAKNS